MQELEKILEEIECKKVINMTFKHNFVVRMKDVRDIIRKHMNEDNDIVEQCPHCGNELALHWNVEKDGYEVYCPYCGFPVMLCSMCNARDGKVCDWTENVGCKHSSERYRDYFGKHMNDGWISVEERLPEDLEDVLVDFGDERPTIAWYSKKIKMWEDSKAGSIIRGVIAWRPLPEPYKPSEESAEEKSMREREEFFKDGE